MTLAAGLTSLSKNVSMKMRLEKFLRCSLPDSGDEYYTCRFVDNAGDRQVVTLFSTSAKKYGGDLVVGRTYALKRGLARIQHSSCWGCFQKPSRH